MYQAQQDAELGEQSQQGPKIKKMLKTTLL